MEKIKKIIAFLKNVSYKKVFKISFFLLYTCAIVLITYAVVNTYFGRTAKVVTVVEEKENNEKSTLTAKVLEEKLYKNAQLSAAKLKIIATAEYSGEGIPGITKSQFTVVCEATIKAGFDMGRVKVKVDDKNKKVYITMPAAEIKPEDVYIDHEQLRFYDKKFVLFPVEVHENTAKALALTERVAKEYAQESGLLEMADKQGAEIVKGILSDVIPDEYKVEIIKEEKKNAKK